MLYLLGCVDSIQNVNSRTYKTKIETDKQSRIPEFSSENIARSFDYPVGKPPGNGYYIAQKFQENAHLGEDWNAVTGGNTDLGDPIYAIANG